SITSDTLVRLRAVAKRGICPSLTNVEGRSRRRCRQAIRSYRMRRIASAGQNAPCRVTPPDPYSNAELTFANAELRCTFLQKFRLIHADQPSIERDLAKKKPRSTPVAS